MLAWLYSLGMNKKFFTKFSVKDKAIKQELVRAHGMIVLLSIALVAQLSVTAAIDTDYDQTVALIVGLLLTVVALISTSVVVAILRGKK